MAVTKFVSSEAIIWGFVVILGTISLTMVTDRGLARFLPQQFFPYFMILRFKSSKVSLVRFRTSLSWSSRIPSSWSGRCPSVRGVVGGMSNGGSSLCLMPKSIVSLVSPCFLSPTSFSLSLLSSSSRFLFSSSANAYCLSSSSSMFFSSCSNLLFSSFLLFSTYSSHFSALPLPSLFSLLPPAFSSLLLTFFSQLLLVPVTFLTIVSPSLVPPTFSFSHSGSGCWNLEIVSSPAPFASWALTFFLPSYHFLFLAFHTPPHCHSQGLQPPFLCAT